MSVDNIDIVNSYLMLLERVTTDTLYMVNLTMEFLPMFKEECISLFVTEITYFLEVRVRVPCKEPFY